MRTYQHRNRPARRRLVLAGVIAAAGLVHASPSGAAGGLSIADATVTETNASGAGLTFVVKLPSAASAPVSFRWATGTGSAREADFTASSGIGRIAGGQTQTTVRVPVAGDTTDEYDETVYVTVYDPVGATITDGSATGTIVDNDALPALRVADVDITEGGDSGVTRASFIVSLSAASGRTVSAAMTTADGTLVAPGDYRARTATLSFAPGVTRAAFAVDLVNDNVAERVKTMSARLTRATNASPADAEGVLRLTDDDSPPPRPANHVVVNEVDYDQPGTDGREFVELHNPTAAAVSLDGMSLVFHNGFDGKVYKTVALKGSIGPRGFAVVAGPDVAVDPKAVVFRFDAATSNIQNGPDAITLLAGRTVVDSVAYEATLNGAGEGEAAPADSDSQVGAIARTGAIDSGDNDADFRFVTTPTPGR